MSLLVLRNVNLAFGSHALLEDASATVESGERVCLLGRNGTGKSSLLGLISGELAADSGEMRVDPALTVASLPQDVPEGIAGSVHAVVQGGLGTAATLLRRHQRLAAEGTLGELDRAERELEAAGAWDVERRAERVLSRLGLAPEADFASLSGGLRRRVLLARALVAEPDLLLLDEPTNHLDIDAIEWLESLILGWRGAVLFTTHDRHLLSRVATRILELDRGRLTSWPGDYDNYLRRRTERDHAEALADARLDRALAREEIWIREGIRARRTRNEGRVRRLERLRAERAARREAIARVRFTAGTARASGRKVIEARAASAGYGAHAVVRDLDLQVERGDRIGIIGANGSGKTTLLELLLGRLAPAAGEVILGTGVEVGYFDQHRALLDGERSVAESVADGAEFVTVGDGKKHVVGYLADFLFPAARTRSPVKTLSGGERARLALARLFATPCNLLALDEPTNDLDIETLELLEERLSEFAGTLLLVSHDRRLLDNVVTSTLVLEAGGRVGEYVGGYADWVRQRPAPPEEPGPTQRGERRPARRPAPGPRKLSYHEQRELDALPARIERLERGIAQLHERLADPAFYKSGGDAIARAKSELDAAQAELDRTFERWAELEDAAP